MTVNPRRCLLFVPGARAERFEKALASGADLVCIDLEDAVGPDDKVSAREATLDFIVSAQRGNAELGLRVNGITSELGLADLKRIVERGARPDFVMLPKTENADEILLAEKILAGTSIGLIALLESPRAIFSARKISAASKRVQALMFGGYDYAVAARVKPGERGWLWARANLAAAAAEAEIGAIDVPSLEINQLADVAAETASVIALGFTGKAAIHPSQVTPIQNEFLPTEAEHRHASRVIDAVTHATSAAIQLDGKMIDRPIELAARRVMELAKAGVRQ